jgi:ribosome-binding protein aMBF1 (putative translation factor)
LKGAPTDGERKCPTPTQLREWLDAIGWTQRGLAAQLDCDERMVRRWFNGEWKMPPSVAAWLKRIAAAHTSNPAPQGWRTRHQREN